jgi:AcrR family transcriptional regulator
MAENPPPAAAKGSRLYHHGDLRNALLAAALELITEKGPKGFSLTEAARRAGVSVAAPYRHFADREALLAAIALQGTQMLREQIEQAVTAPGLDLPGRFVAGAQAYVGFARRQRAYFLTMFGADVDKARYPEVLTAVQAALGVVAELLKEFPAGRLPPEKAAVAPAELWAISHGVASLLTDGAFEQVVKGLPAERLVEGLVRGYLVGSGL